MKSNLIAFLRATVAWMPAIILSVAAFLAVSQLSASENQPGLATADPKVLTQTPQTGLAGPTAISKNVSAAKPILPPSAIFLREFHTPSMPAAEPTRRAKLTW